MADSSKPDDIDLDFMEDLSDYKPTNLLRSIVKQKEELVNTREIDYNNAKKILNDEILLTKDKINKYQKAKLKRLNQQVKDKLTLLEIAKNELKHVLDELKERTDEDETKDDESDDDFMIKYYKNKYYKYKKKYINLKKQLIN